MHKDIAWGVVAFGILFVGLVMGVSMDKPFLLKTEQSRIVIDCAAKGQAQLNGVVITCDVPRTAKAQP